MSNRLQFFSLGRSLHEVSKRCSGEERTILAPQSKGINFFKHCFHKVITSAKIKASISNEKPIYSSKTWAVPTSNRKSTTASLATKMITGSFSSRTAKRYVKLRDSVDNVSLDLSPAINNRSFHAFPQWSQEANYQWFLDQPDDS